MTHRRPWDAEQEVTEDTARAALRRGASARLSLVEAPLRRVGEGWDNVVFQVGEAHALRLPRRALAADLLAGEGDFLAAWADHLPLPVPRVVGRLPAGDGYPHEALLVTWTPGQTGCAPLSAEERASCGETLGSFLRALHRLPPILPPSPSPSSSVMGGGGMGWGDTLRRADVPHRVRLLREVLAVLAAEAPDLDLHRSAAVPLLDALEAQPPSPWPRAPCWVHGDLYGRHLLLHRRLSQEGGGVVLGGVIDWGDVHLGDPALDLSVALSWLPAAGRAAFVEAYGAVDEATWARARLRTLHYALHLRRYARSTGDAGMDRLATLAWEGCLSPPT